MKLLSSGRRTPLAGLLVLVAFVGSGCVKPEDPKVGITKVEADLVFGVKEKDAAGVTPPNQGLGLGEGAAAPGNEGFSFPEFIDKSGGNFGGLNIPSVTPSDCPTADPTDSAKDVVDVTLTGEPKLGVYKWKKSGEQKPAGAPAEQPGTKFSGYEKRIVRNYKKIADGITEFETVQLQGAGQVIVSTFRVRTNALNRGTTDGLPVASGPRVGEPDRGVTLTKLEVLDSKGNTVSSWSPVIPLLYLPLPVASGEEFQSVGVDAKSGQTIVHNARVLGRERVDACGELVDGWAVEATQVTTVAGAPALQVVYKYLIAPQFGGVIISEKLTYDATETHNDLKFELGQYTPDALPPS